MNAQLLWTLAIMNHKRDKFNGLHLLCFSGFCKSELKTKDAFVKCYNEMCNWQVLPNKSARHGHAEDCRMKDVNCELLHILPYKPMQAYCSEFTSILLPGRKYFPLINELFNKGRVSYDSIENMEFEVRDADDRLGNKFDP
jgi:hypothetical protein